MVKSNKQGTLLYTHYPIGIVKTIKQLTIAPFNKSTSEESAILNFGYLYTISVQTLAFFYEQSNSTRIPIPTTTRIHTHTYTYSYLFYFNYNHDYI